MPLFQTTLVIRECFMIKRSQNKKALTRVNYKKRWFVLTKKFLIYYDDCDESVSIFLVSSIFIEIMHRIIDENTVRYLTLFIYCFNDTKMLFRYNLEVDS